MILAIASGKGGTGKTTVATNLATVTGRGVRFLDCDVEEPNAHIFLKPGINFIEKVTVPVPKVDEDKCNYCGECADLCEFSAIVTIQNSVLTFPELCHNCGGCALVCPTKAITEVKREIGLIKRGYSVGIDFIQGSLNIGEAKSPPLINAVKKYIKAGGITIIDAPPGTSCPVIESIKNSDYVILVTEPTPFGLSDLKLAVGMVREMGIRFGVVINRASIGERDVENYCLQENIQVLLKIPDRREIAVAYSKGETASPKFPDIYRMFKKLFTSIENELQAYPETLKTAKDDFISA